MKLNRRDFIKGAATVGAIVAVTHDLPAQETLDEILAPEPEVVPQPKFEQTPAQRHAHREVFRCNAQDYQMWEFKTYGDHVQLMNPWNDHGTEDVEKNNKKYEKRLFHYARSLGYKPRTWFEPGLTHMIVFIIDPSTFQPIIIVRMRPVPLPRRS